MQLENKSVLIIDDTELQRVMMTEMLERMGIGEIYTAADGIEGVRNARFYKPDLILLDLSMPNMDGYETCEKIRLFANKITIPIIVITGQERLESLERIYELGANDYFGKPYNSTEVKNRILFYLEYCDMMQKLHALEKHIQQDLEIARIIQTKSLPDGTESKTTLLSHGIDFDSYHGLDRLGGDSWFLGELNCGNPIFLMFDVTGHGINASINNSFVTSLTIQLFQEYKQTHINNFCPKSFLTDLNQLVCDHVHPGTYSAAVCFSLDEHKNLLKYAGCALPPFKSTNTKTGQVLSYDCKGLPLGISEDGFIPTTGKIELSPDLFLMFLTDGLIEAMPPHKASLDEYDTLLPGEKLLNTCLEDMYKQEFEKNCEQIMQYIIKEFEDKKYDLSGDDVTVLGIKLIDRV